MFVGRIFKSQGMWAAECEVMGIWTCGRSSKEACEMIADVMELMVGRPGFKSHVSKLGPDDRGGITVWIDANDRSLLAAAALRHHREWGNKSLSDIARALGAASRNAYASYEQGQREPSLTKYRELLAAVAPDVVLVVAPRARLAGLSRGLDDGAGNGAKRTTNGAKHSTNGAPHTGTRAKRIPSDAKHTAKRAKRSARDVKHNARRAKRTDAKPAS